MAADFVMISLPQNHPGVFQKLGAPHYSTAPQEATLIVWNKVSWDESPSELTSHLSNSLSKWFFHLWIVCHSGFCTWTTGIAMCCCRGHFLPMENPRHEEVGASKPTRTLRKRLRVLCLHFFVDRDFVWLDPATAQLIQSFIQISAFQITTSETQISRTIEIPHRHGFLPNVLRPWDSDWWLVPSICESQWGFRDYPESQWKSSPIGCHQKPPFLKYLDISHKIGLRWKIPGATSRMWNNQPVSETQLAGFVMAIWSHWGPDGSLKPFLEDGTGDLPKDGKVKMQWLKTVASCTLLGTTCSISRPQSCRCFQNPTFLSSLGTLHISFLRNAGIAWWSWSRVTQKEMNWFQLVSAKSK